MAIDDVISDFEASVSSGGRASFQPASGDEWLITHLHLVSNGWNLNSHTDGTNFECGLFGGFTTPAGDNIAETAGIHRYNLFVTNSEYIRVKNGTGATNDAGFSGIKSKD